VHRMHYLHGYYGAMPTMSLIALFTPMTRSTNRSTASVGILQSCYCAQRRRERPTLSSACELPESAARRGTVILLDLRGGGLDDC
jgi:hypothetical protein